VDDLVTAAALVFEQVLGCTEKPDCSQCDIEFFAELAAQRTLGGLTELDAATDGAIERPPFTASEPSRTRM